MKKATIYNFTNENIEFHKKQQLYLFENVRASQENYNHWHTKYMENPTEENHSRALRAFETLTYDRNNMDMHRQRELEERLRVAQSLLAEHGIEIPSGVNSQDM